MLHIQIYIYAHVDIYCKFYFCMNDKTMTVTVGVTTVWFHLLSAANEIF